MKKIYFLALVLLALTLATCPVVGSTFAKYVARSEGADNARVAKWGVTCSITGGAFATQYNSDVSYDSLDVSVKSNNSNNIIAPGTTGTFSGIQIAGIPEVAVKVVILPELSFSGSWTDSSGRYYCPLRIIVNGVEYYGMDYSSTAEFKEVVEEAIKTASTIYPPGTNLANIDGLNGDYVWLWDFTGTDGKQTDLKDTDLAVKEFADANSTPTISLVVSASVTQSEYSSSGLVDGGEFDIPEGGDEFWG